jgi:hypothetical protein
MGVRVLLEQVLDETEHVIHVISVGIILTLTIAPAQVISAYFAGWSKIVAALFALSGLDDRLFRQITFLLLHSPARDRIDGRAN